MAPERESHAKDCPVGEDTKSAALGVVVDVFRGGRRRDPRGVRGVDVGALLRELKVDTTPSSTEVMDKRMPEAPVPEPRKESRVASRDALFAVACATKAPLRALVKDAENQTKGARKSLKFAIGEDNEEYTAKT